MSKSFRDAVAGHAKRFLDSGNGVMQTGMIGHRFARKRAAKVVRMGYKAMIDSEIEEFLLCQEADKAESAADSDCGYYADEYGYSYDEFLYDAEREAELEREAEAAGERYYREMETYDPYFLSYDDLEYY